MHVRWMQPTDRNRIVEIEGVSCENPWKHSDFSKVLSQAMYIGMVCEHRGRVVGFLIYGLYPMSLHIVNIATCMPRQGVATSLITSLKTKIATPRNRLTLEVRENNLGAQLFFRSVGFRAKMIIHDLYESGEDAYFMQHLPAPMPSERFSFATVQ